jgi:hypothetical protein
MDWTRITDPDTVMQLLPAWFSGRMLDARGAFGLLLVTGDVLRITEIKAFHHGSDGTLLADVLLDHAGVPEGVDQAWRTKHYLGSPVPGAVLATVAISHVIAAIEFVAAVDAEPPRDLDLEPGNELPVQFEAAARPVVRPVEGWR